MKQGPAKSIQYPKITAAETSGFVSVRISFPFQTLNHVFTLEVPKNLYEGAKSSGKSALVPAGLGDTWLLGYYQAFALDPLLTGFYQSLLTKFREIRNRQNLSSDEYLELLTAYVQSLAYDTKKLEDKNRVPRFPVETVVDNTGICSDKSILLAGLLSHEGYAVSLLQFGPENHVAVGIPVQTGYDYQKTGYAVIESTVISYVGDVSGEFAPDRKISSRPKIFPIGHGSKRYESIADVSRITSVLEKLKERLNPEGEFAREILRQKEKISLEKNRLKVCLAELSHEEEAVKMLQEKNDPEFLARYQSYKQNIDAYNAEVTAMTRQITRYNLMVEEYNRFASDVNFIQQNRLNRKAAFLRIKNIVI